MTLSDFWPWFQGHIFEVEYRKKRRVLKIKLLLHKRKLYLIWNGTIFGDLNWPLGLSASAELLVCLPVDTNKGNSLYVC